jgi:sulfite reductase alpha subunit-like flavoprotein
MKTVHQEFLLFRGYSALDAYYSVYSSSYGQQLYVARFVKVGAQVYNMYYSNAAFYIRGSKKGFSKEHIEKTLLTLC